MKITNMNFRKKILLSAFAVGILLGFAEERVAGQEVIQSRDVIRSVEPTSIVVVRLLLRATEKPIVIPYCSEDETQEYRFCFEAVSLEVFRNGKWVIVESRKEWGLVIAFPSREDWKFEIMAPGKSAFILFNFNPSFFSVHKNERLRLVVSSWSSQESARNNDPGTALISPEFQCP
jgi:hypothetical protein